jgi:AraC-like DNA-binding protein
MARLLLSAAAEGGADAAALARDAQLPDWALADDRAMISPRHALRLWELVEHALPDRDVALTVAARHRVGELDLYDYLFTTAATLRDGLQASARYLPLMTTNGRLRTQPGAGREATYSYSCLEADGRGGELAMQFFVAGRCARARAATGRRVVPVHAALAQPAPRSYRALAEMLGTRRIDFGAPATTVTFRAGDLDLPMLGADPVLAGVLDRYAASLPLPHPITWHDHFQQQLSEVIEDGSPSLEAMARRMVISVRTLQRRLADHGTTWRAELDIARRRRAQHARQAGPPGMTRLARQLGYADPRSARRAMSRWDNPRPGRQATGAGRPAGAGAESARR